ncbi:hypothetical protein Q4555_04075 [Octadecabacter sp. 1_MG-2023]|uniref:DUF1127 domain-containing protein n=1 Tax=unclassified Octadecabacter TaxID=196158 RepID=UPI001C096BA3|nr:MULTISPECIES: hypothetical protein [unclassified Octadecabacter]MBU2992718.1 hypothetical protein [Octadecabacter sp. B2R22]MDO6733831.1 hypothetical protein [Octadecabacter sp. 1_MG-2023]
MTHSLSRADCLPRTTSQSAPRTTLGTYMAVWKQRRELASMDVNRLKDLGISAEAAIKEAARPFWDLPL